MEEVDPVGDVVFVYMLKRYKNKKLGHFRQSVHTLIEDFERTRETGRYSLGPCPESCHVTELSAYELKDLLREHELDNGSLHCREMCELVDSLGSLPKFPFSARYAPCSASCLFHRLARSYNNDFLVEQTVAIGLPMKLV
ncbi:hypothetical protein LTR36_010676 [Oleoguttula mirabilis]|uniref:Uncharacterized protein n=1 Tax=Oleoguttula mirabilis TaxID=1507867 RepID=A0AAV9JSH4_9PEZI|nr:hypothetical protein LTR36_010676 [Oleoguttula mirabilis]